MAHVTSLSEHIPVAQQEVVLDDLNQLVVAGCVGRLKVQEYHLRPYATQLGATISLAGPANLPLCSPLQVQQLLPACPARLLLLYAATPHFQTSFCFECCRNRERVACLPVALDKHDEVILGRADGQALQQRDQPRARPEVSRLKGLLYGFLGVITQVILQGQAHTTHQVLHIRLCNIYGS